MQVPLFQNTEIGFTKLLALSIKPVLYLSKEYIVRKGDIGSEVRHSYHNNYMYTCTIIVPFFFLHIDVFYKPWNCRGCK